MASSGKQSEADADEPGFGLYVGQVDSGHPFLKQSSTQSIIKEALRETVLTLENSKY